MLSLIKLFKPRKKEEEDEDTFILNTSSVDHAGLNFKKKKKKKKKKHINERFVSCSSRFEF